MTAPNAYYWSRSSLPQPTTLYHYTSPAGLYGIVTSRQLWATHVRCLNDSSEYRQAIEVARELMTHRAQIAHNKDEVCFLEGQSYDPLHVAETEAFVFSLSAESDLLSQWRGYCPHTGGCAIGFDVACLSERLSVTNIVQLEKCIYEPKEQRAVLEHAIDCRVIDFLASLKAAEREPSELDEFASIALWSDIADVAPKFKHASFAEEREWRLVAHPREEADIRHRPGRINIVPFVAIPLGKDPLPIVEIVVGPSAHQELITMSTSSFLYYAGVKASIRGSRIPFRSLQ